MLQFVAYLFKNHIWPWNWPFDLEDNPKLSKYYQRRIFQSKSHRKGVLGLHLFLPLLVRNHIFAYLTLKLTQWPWKLPFIIKIVTEMDYSVKMTSKRRTALLLLIVFAKNYIFTFLTLGLTFYIIGTHSNNVSIWFTKRILSTVF